MTFESCLPVNSSKDFTSSSVSTTCTDCRKYQPKHYYYGLPAPVKTFLFFAAMQMTHLKTPAFWEACVSCLSQGSSTDQLALTCLWGSRSYSGFFSVGTSSFSLSSAPTLSVNLPERNESIELCLPAMLAKDCTALHMYPCFASTTDYKQEISTMKGGPLGRIAFMQSCMV